MSEDRRFYQKTWFFWVLGLACLILTFGYRLRPDNPHQWLILSDIDPATYPKLPWLTTPANPWFHHAAVRLGDWLGIQWVFLGIHLTSLIAVMTSLAMLLVRYRAQPATLVLSTALICLFGLEGIAVKGWIKGYVTPSSLAGSLQLLGVTGLLTGRPSTGRILVALAPAMHVGFLPASALLIIATFNRRADTISISRVPEMIIALLLAGFTLNGQWEMVDLGTRRFRRPEVFGFDFATDSRFLYTAVLCAIGVVGLPRNPLNDRVIGTLAAGSVVALACPLDWQFTRFTVLLEFVGVFAISNWFVQCLHGFRNPVAVGTAIVMLTIQSPLPPLTSNVHVREEDRPLVHWFQQAGEKIGPVLIPPTFTNFRTLTHRVPYVDIAAVPWSRADAEIWNRRMGMITGTPPGSTALENALALYDKETEDLLKLGEATGCSHVVWPVQALKTPLPATADVAHRDDKYVVIRVRPPETSRE